MNCKIQHKQEKYGDEVVKIENNLVLQYYRFLYLGATIERNWDFQLDIANRSEQGGQSGEKSYLNAVRFSSATLIKGAFFYKMTVTSCTSLHEDKSWATKKQEANTHVVEMHMLR